MCRCTRIHLFEGNETIDILPSLLPTLHLLRYHPKSTAHYAATHSTVSPLGDHESPRKEWCRCTTKDRHLGKSRVSGRLNLRLLIFWGVYWCLGFNRKIIQSESISLWEGLFSSSSLSNYTYSSVDSTKMVSHKYGHKYGKSCSFIITSAHITIRHHSF